MRFSKTTGCFYPESDRYLKLPPDLIDVPQEDFDVVMAREPGDVVDVVNGRVVVTPKPAPTPGEVKVAKWEVIKLIRDRRIEQSGFQVGGKWYHSDAKSKLQHLGNKDSARDQLAAGGTMAAALLDPLTGFPIKWKTMDGSWQPLTVQLAFDIVAAGKASELAHHAAAEQHRAAMEAAADPAAYDFSGGWPASYQPEPTK